MSESKDAIVSTFLKPIMELWAGRDERKAAKESAKLRFWKDGMLEELKKIADGKGKEKAYKELRVKLRKSEADVSAVIVVLKKVRDRLGGGAVAKAIDEVLHNEDFGKGNIRHQIKLFLEEDETQEARQSRAKEICFLIERLNGALDRLYRLVYE
ncbi:MAG TPA: hypothetical protein VKW08_00410 [Xanthobacteraceae bacterium]|nr:hypothetical protein [Xanthobacteraceae bacterium]